MSHTPDTSITWYFDYVSPFAYLQHELIERDPLAGPVTPVPILFAGLLGAWGQLGPAEIPPKRVFTYQHTTWLAGRLNIPITYPAGHPFNPLALLRATVATGNDPAFIRNAFRWVWRDGNLPGEGPEWLRFLKENGIAPEQLDDPLVKNELRDATRAAAQAGVFGVPTACVDGQQFWGVDALEMLRDYLSDPTMMESTAMKRVRDLPTASARKQAS